MKKKQRKVKSAPKAAARKRAPSAKPQAKVKTTPAVKGPTFPVVVLVAKAGDKIPVTVVDQAHLDRLKHEHGEASVVPQ